MKALKEKIKYLFTDTRGLIFLNMGITMLIVLVFGMLSGPMKEWGVSELVIKLLKMDLQPQDREGRIVILYHSIALSFIALLTYIITDILKMKEHHVKNTRNLITTGYLLVVIFGLGFAYWGRNWAFHGLFVVGMTLSFFAGVQLAIGLWPWNKDYMENDADYSRTRKGFSMERIAFFVTVMTTLGSSIFGAVAAAHYKNGFETFLAENSIRHVHHTKLQLAVVGHLHIMLALICVMVALIIGRWFDWKGKTHKIGMPLFISGTLLLTLGVWSVVPFKPIAHKIIYVGCVFAMTGALFLVIFGWGKLIREGVSGEEKPGLLKRMGALVRDPLKFGSLWQMVFMNFCVSGVGIFMAINLRKIFRVIPHREERIALTGHWHILAVLTATIVLFYIMSETFPLKGKFRKIFGWSVIISSDIAFAMMTLFAMKRLWVSEENQQPFVDFFMVITDITLAVLLASFGIYLLWLLVRFIQNRIDGFLE